MDSAYRCVGCSSEGLSWKETSVVRSDAAGVGNTKARTRQVSRNLRDQLKALFEKSDRAIWVAVQNRGKEDPDQYWVGRATAVGEPFKEGGSVSGTNGRALRAVELMPLCFSPLTHAACRSSLGCCRCTL